MNEKLKQVLTMVIIAIIGVISSVVIQMRNSGAIDMQSLVVDTARFVVIIWLAFWAGSAAKNKKDKE